MSDQLNDATPATKPSRRRQVLIGGAVAVLATLLVLPFAAAHKGWGPFKRAEVTPELVQERMTYVADKVMDKLDGTEAQRSELDALIDSLVPDAVAFHKEGRALKAKFRAALTSDTIDAKELENLRQEGLSLADRASRRALSAIVTASAITPPEQRQQLQAHIDARRARWHRRMQRWHADEE